MVSRVHPRIALGYFTLEALLLYPPRAIVMRLHRRDVSYAVILIGRLLVPTGRQLQ